jgi:hypothetical protein
MANQLSHGSDHTHRIDQLAIATNAQTVKNWAPAMLRICLTGEVKINHSPTYAMPCQCAIGTAAGGPLL